MTELDAGNLWKEVSDPQPEIGNLAKDSLTPMEVAFPKLHRKSKHLSYTQPNSNFEVHHKLLHLYCTIWKEIFHCLHNSLVVSSPPDIVTYTSGTCVCTLFGPFTKA